MHGMKLSMLRPFDRHSVPIFALIQSVQSVITFGVVRVGSRKMDGSREKCFVIVQATDRNRQSSAFRGIPSFLVNKIELH
jgi:hypothetical protein